MLRPHRRVKNKLMVGWDAPSTTTNKDQLSASDSASASHATPPDQATTRRPAQTAIIKRFPEPLPVSHRKHFSERARTFSASAPRRPHEIPERAAPGGEEESRPGPQHAVEGQDAKREDKHSHASAAAGRRRGEGSAPGGGGVLGEGGGADRARHWGHAAPC